MGVIEWMLDSDPSIRWQVMRDLTADNSLIRHLRRQDLELLLS